MLKLFTMKCPQWTVEEAAAALGMPVSTIYRYFRSLSEAGLLGAYVAGRYVIGPAIFELDRQARLLDPLIAAARQALTRLVADDRPNHIALLCRLYRSTVICVDHRASASSSIGSSYERGRPMPLFRGAASKIILAHMPQRVRDRLFQSAQHAIVDAGLGGDLRTYRNRLKALRRTGVSVTYGELDPGLIGVSAPVFGLSGEIVASIGIAAPAVDLQDGNLELACEHVIQAGHAVTEKLAVDEAVDQSDARTVSRSRTAPSRRL